MISEEDKTSRTSVEYWFKVVDLNCDGVITPDEMKYFYDEQFTRFEYIDHIPIPFSDILCQLADMLKPEEGYRFRLESLLKAPYYASIFFNSLLNLTKLIAFEERDLFKAKEDNKKFPDFSDWDKFAFFEYQRLAVDESDEEEAGNDPVFDEIADSENDGKPIN
jgi:serine/threonine-protein phosphatase 2A regulatory subunit B''